MQDRILTEKEKSLVLRDRKCNGCAKLFSGGLFVLSTNIAKDPSMRSFKSGSQFHGLTTQIHE